MKTKALTQEEMTRRFSKAYPVSNEEQASNLKDKLQESGRMFNVIEMDGRLWVLPHRVAVKKFRNLIVKLEVA
jgi:hypothetical protein